jgi:hypothetical protein
MPRIKCPLTINDNSNTNIECSLQHVQKLEEERAAYKVSVNSER